MIDIIYFDNAATTKVDEHVAYLMADLTSQFGNPGAIYKIGRDSKGIIDNARENVSKIFNCDKNEVIFTSGGTESNNAAVNSAIIDILRSGKTDIIISGGEHDSVFNSVTNIASRYGLNVKVAPLMSDGRVDISELERMIDDNTGLVSVMYVNNETGAVNNVEEIGSMCLKRNILFHTDCVQAAGSEIIDVKKIGCDFASISSHKIHGPKGIGALYVKNIDTFTPLIYGGSDQEYGLRGGTENMVSIAGFGEACKIMMERFEEDKTNTSILKQEMFKALKEYLGESVSVNGPSVISPGRILNIQIKDYDAETLILALDSLGIYLSAGSACRSRAANPSRVLTNMGVPEVEARSSIRISFSRYNSLNEVKLVADAINDIVSINSLQ